MANVVVVGAHGEFCVPDTAIDLAKLGYRTIVVEDTVVFADDAADKKDAVWTNLKTNGVEIVSHDDSVLDAIKKGK